MKQENRTQFENWASTNNGHPCDFERLYEIVVATLEDPAEQKDFEAALHENALHYYEIYEHLREFLLYLQRNNICNS